jgi:hypothetical protein
MACVFYLNDCLQGRLELDMPHSVAVPPAHRRSFSTLKEEGTRGELCVRT